MHCKVKQMGNPPVDMFLRLFDTCIEQVISYGAEVWGFKNASCVNMFMLCFYKYLLGVKQTVKNAAVYSELGNIPFQYYLNIR